MWRVALRSFTKLRKEAQQALHVRFVQNNSGGCVDGTCCRQVAGRGTSCAKDSDRARARACPGAARRS